jgi:hypothetical protein
VTTANIRKSFGTEFPTPTNNISIMLNKQLEENKLFNINEKLYDPVIDIRVHT